MFWSRTNETQPERINVDNKEISETQFEQLLIAKRLPPMLSAQTVLSRWMIRCPITEDILEAAFVELAAAVILNRNAKARSAARIWTWLHKLRCGCAGVQDETRAAAALLQLWESSTKPVGCGDILDEIGKHQVFVKAWSRTDNEPVVHCGWCGTEMGWLQNAFQLECEHVFHADCRDAITDIQQEGTCPSCFKLLAEPTPLPSDAAIVAPAGNVPLEILWRQIDVDQSPNHVAVAAAMYRLQTWRIAAPLRGPLLMAAFVSVAHMVLGPCKTASNAAVANLFIDMHDAGCDCLQGHDRDKVATVVMCNWNHGQDPTCESLQRDLRKQVMRVVFEVVSAHDEVACCAFCKDTLALESTCARLPCGHLFHADANQCLAHSTIVDWLESQRACCPVC